MACFNNITIGIDIDDTIFTCVSTMLDYINERIGTNIKMEDLHSYWLEDYVPLPFKWIVENGFHDKAFWKAIRPIERAGEAIVKLRRKGFNIYFVTASLPEKYRGDKAEIRDLNELLNMTGSYVYLRLSRPFKKMVELTGEISETEDGLIRLQYRDKAATRTAEIPLEDVEFARMAVKL